MDTYKPKKSLSASFILVQLDSIFRRQPILSNNFEIVNKPRYTYQTLHKIKVTKKARIVVYSLSAAMSLFMFFFFFC